MIVLGIVLGQAFLMWTHRRQAAGKTPLLALEVIDSPQERAAVYCMFAVVALEAMLNFSVPLYIQIVQGRSPIATAIAMMPFNLTVFFTAMLIVRFYPKFTPRQIGRYGFILCTIALLWLALVVRNDWSAVPVLFGLVVFGIGQGALVTLLFNVLVTASPKELAGDVGSLRGTTNNLAAAVGTAVAGALLVGLLSSIMLTAINASPKLTPELQAQVDLDSINFVSNDRLAGDARQDHGQSGAGRGSGAGQHGVASACAEDRTADHGGRRTACDFPGRLSAEFPAGRNSGSFARRPTQGRQIASIATDFTPWA